MSVSPPQPPPHSARQQRSGFCFHCGARLQAPEDAATEVECTSCFSKVPFPPATAPAPLQRRPYPPGVRGIDINFACAGCGQLLLADVRLAEQRAPCPGCASWLRIPALPSWLASSGPAPAMAASAQVTLSSEEVAFLSQIPQAGHT